MARLEGIMTTDERKLTAALLRLAADEFANHTCGDFNLAQFIPDADERDALVVESYGELFGDGRGDKDWRLDDSALMYLMADRLEEGV
jgi:hypothetical protein